MIPLTGSAKIIGNRLVYRIGALEITVKITQSERKALIAQQASGVSK